MNTEQVNGITYSLSEEFYVMHHEAGVVEVEGPWTPKRANFL